MSFLQRDLIRNNAEYILEDTKYKKARAPTRSHMHSDTDMHTHSGFVGDAMSAIGIKSSVFI